MSFALFHDLDELPPPNVYICHTCDNPSCVNPHHLFKGDHSINVQDMHEKKEVEKK